MQQGRRGIYLRGKCLGEAFFDTLSGVVRDQFMGRLLPGIEGRVALPVALRQQVKPDIMAVFMGERVEIQFA